MAASGYSNREIAAELDLTEQIIKNTLHSVFDKLGVWNRVELANRVSMMEIEPIIVPDPSPGTDARSSELLSRESPQQVWQDFDPPNKAAGAGMELRDLLHDREFPLRRERHGRQMCAAEAYRALACAFADKPDVILQRLVEAATTFCGADSAGISLEEEKDKNGQQKFRWIALSGSFSSFLGGTTPRFFSPCGTTLDRGRVQLYRVGKAYYDYLGIKADPITDGILIPWKAGERRGTLWVVSHRHREAFDVEDFKLIEGLADFAALAVGKRFKDGAPQPSRKKPAA